MYYTYYYFLVKACVTLCSFCFVSLCLAAVSTYSTVSCMSRDHYLAIVNAFPVSSSPDLIGLGTRRGSHETILCHQSGAGLNLVRKYCVYNNIDTGKLKVAKLHVYYNYC